MTAILHVKEVRNLLLIRMLFFFLGLVTVSLGITITINVQYLGLHPWDVLAVGLYHKLGLTVGSWGILIGVFLTIISLILDRTYVKIGTFINLVAIGLFIDFFLWIDFLPKASSSWTDIVILLLGVSIMGLGGGLYSAAGLGAGPRDGFMLSISDKTGLSIGKVRMITETIVLLFGLLIGGPVFIFSFLITFIQSPIFQLSFERLSRFVERMEGKYYPEEKTAT